MSWRDVSAAAVAAIAATTVTLAWHARNARNDDEAWERLLEAAWGVDGTVGIVLLLAVAPLAALLLVRRFGGDTTGDVLVGVGSTAAVAGSGMLATHLLARPSGVGQLAIPGGAIAFVAAVAAVATVLIVVVLRRRPTVRAVLATWAMVLGSIGLVLTAAFGDNAEQPTPAFVTVALIVAVVLVGMANRPGPLEWVGVGVLVAAIVGLRWILDDAVACHDDDCLPLPFSAAWLSVGAIWLGAKWWRRDSRRRRANAATD